MSTPVDPAESARRLQSAAQTQGDGDQAPQPNHATHIYGPATTRQQVVNVLDRVRDGAPGSQRLSMGNGTLCRTRHNIFNTSTPPTATSISEIQRQTSFRIVIEQRHRARETGSPWLCQECGSNHILWQTRSRRDNVPQADGQIPQTSRYRQRGGND